MHIFGGTDLVWKKTSATLFITAVFGNIFCRRHAKPATSAPLTTSAFRTAGYRCR